MSIPKTIMIDNVKYIQEGTQEKLAVNTEGLKYVIIRTYSAGIFAGYLKEKDGLEVTLTKARRLWKWSGAASLSQLSVDGTNDPSNCKFPCEVESITLQWIEIIPCTEKSRKSISEVEIWKM